MYFEKLCREYSALPEVEAIALGGSRAGDNFDEKSDYDLYIYCRTAPGENVRMQILNECCGYIELSNSFWELEDDCTLKDGVDIDIIYRNPDDFAHEISSVVDDFTAHNGYTTCMWHNLLNSRILFDRNGEYKKLQKKYSIPYPKQLKENIIAQNMRLLTGNLPSYDRQIVKAAGRGDIVSVNHRIAAYVESYFDIIFAMNEMTHPGEKRMTQFALAGAEFLPDDFEKNINLLLENISDVADKIENIIQTMTDNLKQCLKMNI